MTATLARATVPLPRPARAADEVDALNDRLAAVARVPDEVAGAVRELAGAVRAVDVDRWIAVDPYLALLVHRAVIEAQEALDRPDARAARDALRLALERLSHALGAIAESEPVSDARSSKEVVRWLAGAVEVPQRDLAELLGVDLRRFQRWISPREAAQPEGDDARRVRAVARLVAQLRHAFTAVGVIAWFGWPRRDLDGATPAALLRDAARLPDLLLAAGSTRSTALS